MPTSANAESWGKLADCGFEAGLIARELLLRKNVREMVVSCPPSMLLQRQEELQNRFGLRFEILNKDYIQNVRRGARLQRQSMDHAHALPDLASAADR